ncbi:MAG: hypothetical protein KGJ57_05000 [Sphingomonadales bacterium]|nr:hypothetical protein [Sphingomonadales bacterium]MDE2168774.1 hypothetical protein [Sphingomonadales bacterium]
MEASNVVPLIRPGALSPEKGPTEESLAREFVMAHTSRWRFDHTAHRWFGWDGQRWARDECRLVGYLIAEHLRAAGEATRSPGIASTKTARGVETFARENPELAVTHECWNNDPWLLGTPAGTVDLRTGQLTPADPQAHITKLTAVAPGEGTPALWLRFLTEATGGDQDMVAFLRRWCGYCLTGSTREHAFAFVHGPGGNGKSVFLNTLAGIMADYATTAAMETFADSRNDRHSTELAMLQGARLVTASETEQGRGWAEAKVKAITGGDPVTARFMRQDNFTFTPQFKLTIAGNHAPSLRNVDDAMRRRLNILPFTVKPQNPDRDLEAKLKAEWPQILAWMIGGCLEWQANGLQRPAKVAGATEEYFADQDLFGQWLDERCERGPTLWERPEPLFRSWCAYAHEAGEDAGTSKDFKATLEKRGIIAKRANGMRSFRTVALKHVSAGSAA